MASESGKKHTVFSTLANEKGDYVRKASVFRNFVTVDGSSGFPAERDRYHLYVSLACPWAHRTLIYRKLKGLEDLLPVTVVDWLLMNNGWEFTDKKPKCSLDPLYGCKYMKELYFKADPAYTGRYTVPVLWDKKKETICNNESSEIIRMFNTEFNEFCKTPEQQALDLYPAELRQEIDGYNSWIYDQVNNGVYKCGFATSQAAYDKNITPLFDALDRLEKILESRRFLCGDQLTEADIRLFTTLVRFDMVYVGHFKVTHMTS
jgi:putative glutathione S-transferase